MNSHIELLYNYFIDYAHEAENKNIFEKINKKSISIDFSSKSRKGDIASNFYLVAIKKIKDKNFNFKDDLIINLNKLSFIKSCEITKKGFININIQKEFLFEQIKYLLNKKNEYGKSNLGKNVFVNLNT